MSKKKDYYQILGVSRNSDDKEIKRAYKRLAIKYHPDHNQGDIKSEEKFKEIKEAYEILIDPKKRSHYDKYGNEDFSYENSNDGFDFKSDSFGDIFGDIFSDIFNNNTNNYSSKNCDIKCNLEIDLEDSVSGSIKNIDVMVLDICDICGGTGSKDRKLHNCLYCKGQGKIQIKQGFFIVQQICSHCNGNGKTIKNPCNKCYGKSYIKKNKKFSIKLPMGINTGDYIKITGVGNIYKNNKRGDIYVYIKVKSHPIFYRENDNLCCEVPINFSIAALGGEIEIPFLNNKNIKLKIPYETQTGKLLRVKGKGVNNIKKNIIGDLLCKVIVETPVNLNDKQKKILIDLDNSFKNNNNQNSPKYKTFFDKVKNFFSNL
ncbi:molecular chaperone DnaJ [Candidatus Nardonella dryophthoridicola]|uniref:Chaperone protein DnaJ n=1 Tax=endosymbiont of Rhynchophorus ferrugineus TaxID=1972133 RepID=A0A2Z5T930_9GAMM|nr:molecular chaperone DnaJ [Candidatus Nardonella dryophthoridicola]QTJ62832.1 molecular chaperone DnaJ [Candidatus Nardonella dryophthoridicola]BBA85076.1 chaperone protein DnaJ [endosymbiont of Rhynchophorus ferrugineus]